MIFRTNSITYHIDDSNHDLYHRENGPAVESIDQDGYKAWFIHGKRHRLDGPAVEYGNGTKDWFYNGEEIKCSSQEEFEKIIKLIAFY